MRILVLSDIHANITALEAALAAATGQWQQVVCLGDLVDYGPDPNEVTEKVRALDGVVIRGNHDKAVTGLLDVGEFNPVAQIAARWTHQQLRPENFSYIAQLPGGPVAAHGITLVHGAFEDEDEYVFAPAQAIEGLLNSPTAVTMFGHTHYQGGFSYRDQQVNVIQLKPAPGIAFAALRLEPSSRYLINAGSIGQPRDGDPRAAFAIVDLEHSVVEFWRVPYDIAAVQARMETAGLPIPLIMRLSSGH